MDLALRLLVLITFLGGAVMYFWGTGQPVEQNTSFMLLLISVVAFVSYRVGTKIDNLNHTVRVLTRKIERVTVEIVDDEES